MKTAVIAVVLILAVIIAVVFGLRSSGVIGGGPPPEVTGRPITVIDVDTLEMVEISTGEFEGYDIDPDTGYRIGSEGRKLALPVTCVSCGEKIPPVPLPEGIDADSEQEARDSYICPECGNNAYMP